MRMSSPQRYNLLSFAFLSLALFAGLPLHADVVVLKNGDRLTGTAVKLEGGKLSFKTTYADVVAISWDEVSTLTTVQPLVLPNGKQILSVKAVERQPGGLLVTTPSGSFTLPAASVVVLRSPADQQAYEASLHPSWARAWAGTANVNLALSEGNSQTLTYGTGIALARPTRTDKTSLYASTLYSRDQHASLTTADPSQTDDRALIRLFIAGPNFIFDFRPPKDPTRISPPKKSGIGFNAVSPYPSGGALAVGPHGSIATIP